MTVTLVVNPAAGHGRARRLVHPVLHQLDAAGLQVDTRLAHSYDDASTLCADAVASGTDALVVMGGDGMVHLGHNACAGTGVPLGIIPAGTGNDFARAAGLPARWREALDVIVAGVTRRIDLMRVDGHLARGSTEYVGSVLSTGFDERVGSRAARQPVDLGAPSYLVAVLQELRRFSPLRYRLTLDGEIRELDAMLVGVANAGVFGGGIRIAPDYDLTDGLLDVTIVHPVSRGTLLKLFPRLLTGTFITHPAVERFRTASITVDGDGLYGSADGEPIGAVPLDCAAAPGALTLFAPETAVTTEAPATTEEG